MDIRKWSLFLSCFIIFISCAEDTPEMEDKTEICGEDLYFEDRFMTTSTTVQYGSNTNTNGSNIDLMMDIYTPLENDHKNRPVIIWAQGGSFIGGTRQQMEQFTQFFAQKGYVSATIDYRLLTLTGIPDSLEVLDIAVKAMSDMKAAVRFLRNDAQIENNYGIDPSKIYVAGISSGAIVALLVGLLDEGEIVQSHLQAIVNSNGGLDGDSNDLNVSSEVAGIINFSGAIYSLDWIDQNDPPIFSFHGTGDQTVPYSFGKASIFGLPIISLRGSSLIHIQAEQVGIENQLNTVDGGGHTNIYVEDEFLADREKMFEDLTNFMIDEVCN